MPTRFFNVLSQKFAAKLARRLHHKSPLAPLFQRGESLPLRKEGNQEGDFLASLRHNYCQLI
jgi:hypothetical protein